MLHDKKRTTSFILACGVAAVFAQGARAADFDAGDAKVSAKATITFGTAYRTEERDPGLLPAQNATAVFGLPATAVGGRNSDDGNLNYAKGDRVYSVLKGVGDIEVKHGNWGALVRAKAWKDYAMDADRPWGNIPNGYVANAPLGDTGFAHRAKFSGAALQDAYVYGNFSAGGPLSVRLGNQLVPWGTGVTIAGGLAAINPLDLPAIRRPGAVPEETRVPFPALHARYGLDSQTGIEGFYQFRFEPTVLDGCGTFFAGTDYIPEGCNKVFVGAITDRAALAAGSFIKRADTRDPSSSGQLGLGLTHKADAIKTDFGVYFAQYHNRTPNVDVIKSGRPAGSAPLIPGDADGRNVQYFTMYAEKVRVFGLSFTSRLPQATLIGEVTYRPNQPFGLNSVDLLNAFASNTAASLLRPDASGVAPGGLYEGFDRHKVTQAQLLVAKPVGAAVGAASLTLAAEAAVKYVNDLPDVTKRRYGRSDIFGLAPVAGTCVAPATDVQCSNDGFISRTSWGYRARAALAYPAVFPALDLYPTLTVGKDVKGWSYDSVFIQDRWFAVASLRGEYLKRFTIELNYSPIGGGAYNIARDRGLWWFAIGIKI